MRILTIGCGYIGSVLAKDLAENMPLARIVISDSDLNRAEKVANTIERDNVEIIQLDVSGYARFVSTLKDCDLAIGLAPGRMGYETVKACVEAGVDMVDLSFMPEDPLTLHRKAQKADVTVIPDCGVAPGISNMLVGRAYSLLDEVEEAIILVGGIPEKPIGPLGYKVTWCVEDLVEEYTRESKIVKHGKVVEEEALNGLELVEFPGVGKLEAFYTDGVRTLHSTIKGVKNMWEKTLRYPGHAEKVKLLRDLGFFGQTKLQGINVSARELTIELLEENLSLPEISDLLLMNVKVTGSKGESKVLYDYHILDRYDSAGKVTAMARTTAYTASIVVQLLASNEIAEKGVIPPERLGMDEKLFNKIITELNKRGIRISERVEETT